jgi:hypothetical protein
MVSRFDQYQSGALDGKDPQQVPFESPKEQPSEQVVIGLNEFQVKALKLVTHNFNELFFPDAESPAKPGQFYVVWFVKDLGNWKTLISTDIVSGQYWEVTYDGNKNQTYVDHYVKRSNTCITDEVYAAMP